MTSVHGNASQDGPKRPSATTVPMEYLFPRCLPCLSRRQIHNQTSSAIMNKCTDLRKYVLPDPYLLDFFLVLVGTTTSQDIRNLVFFNTLYYKLAML